MNPFQNLNPDQIYALLTDEDNDLPLWPNEKIQAGYTATSGPGAVRKTQAFIDMLDAHGAFVPGWKGLDYGAGWGRIASLLLAKGGPEQLDLVDAWEKSLQILKAGNFKNRRWKVSEIIRSGEIPEKTYNFAYAFSVFTHLAPRAFWPNLEILANSIRSPGSVYFTVRHLEFAQHKYPERVDEISGTLRSEGFWYASTTGDLGTEAIFGDMIISEESLHATLGSEALDYLGQPPGQMQHVYALRS